MATKTQTIITHIDDLDGTEYDEGKGETVKFAIDGSEYEIDLSKDNAKLLRDSLKPYVGAGRPVKRGRRTSNAGTRNSAENLAAIREWAGKNGHAVAPKGRIAQSVQDAYYAAN